MGSDWTGVSCATFAGGGAFASGWGAESCATCAGGAALASCAALGRGGAGRAGRGGFGAAGAAAASTRPKPFDGPASRSAPSRGRSSVGGTWRSTTPPSSYLTS